MDMKTAILVSSVVSATVGALASYLIVVNVEVSQPAQQSMRTDEITSAIVAAHDQIEARQKAEAAQIEAQQKALADERHCKFFPESRYCR